MLLAAGTVLIALAGSLWYGKKARDTAHPCIRAGRQRQKNIM